MTDFIEKLHLLAKELDGVEERDIVEIVRSASAYENRLTVIWINDKGQFETEGWHADFQAANQVQLLWDGKHCYDEDGTDGVLISINDSADYPRLIINKAEVESRAFAVNVDGEIHCAGLVINARAIPAEEITPEYIATIHGNIQVEDLSCIISWSKLHGDKISMLYVDESDKIRVSGYRYQYRKLEKPSEPEGYHLTEVLDIEKGRIEGRGFAADSMGITAVDFPHVEFTMKKGDIDVIAVAFSENDFPSMAGETQSSPQELNTLISEMLEIRKKEVKLLYEFRGEVTDQEKWDEEMNRIRRIEELME